ncbi:uncharacterized protein LOC105257384 isoform X2 [Camponotus floridanus]|uniref:uncharacterized protein LOC105257384 isoform X2 n=1 Tax=Camponotus floridanus TaxID=104421 RepID=UPI000DC66E23|nr:uncharacterized protein LOC105257384 isoform X2 [Camponotus floridanus]
MPRALRLPNETRIRNKSLVNNHKSQCSCMRRKTNLWKLRNDSSEINAVLNPNFCVNPKRTTMSVPNMFEKLTLTSKKPREQFAPRKPVKGCYCNEMNKIHIRSSRTQRKPVSPCRHCRSQLEFKSIKETYDKTALSSPISCETFRRVKKIDYTPRSQFLRNVQNKICELQTGGEGDCLRTCPRSSSYHRFMTSPRMQDIIPDEKSTLSKHKHKYVDKMQSFPASPTAPANSLASEQSGSDDTACTSSKGIQVSSRKLSKSTLRKTIRSKRQIPKSSERPISKSPTRSKKAMQLRKQDCSCCCRNEPKRVAKFDKDECIRMYNLPKYCEQRDQCLEHDDNFIIDSPMDQEVENLRKFREQNYFETHGSSHTLASSRSSGSLQQYLLNERLFPEPIGKIHKQDLVVTMPPCSTIQKKRIHYFPRYVVRQEKNVCNTNYRRKHQSCPLTGHAIDLGILKARPPLNSLALKYQKRVP